MAKQEELDIFQLLEQINSLKGPTIQKLKDEIDERIQKLTALGEHYQLTQDGPQPVKRLGRPAGSTSTPKAGLPPKPEGKEPEGGWKFCQQHGWGDHDTRRHRAENIAKKAQAS